MPINIIIIITFILILSVIAFIYRNATLDKLRPLPGEQTIFEEIGVEIEQGGAPQTIYYRKCIIRVTDARIIIAQKISFMKNKYMLRFVISIAGREARTEIRSTLKSGYHIVSVDRNKISLKPEGVSTLINIPIGEKRYVRFSTRAGNDYRKALVLS